MGSLTNATVIITVGGFNEKIILAAGFDFNGWIYIWYTYNTKLLEILEKYLKFVA